MKEVVKTVDVELSKEETKTLLKAKVICKEMLVILQNIETKRQPVSIKDILNAYISIHKVLGSHGAWFDKGDDKEVDELEEKINRLESEEEQL